MSDVTPREAARRLREFDRSYDRAFINPLRRGQTRVRTRTLNEFRSFGIGRSIFGRRKSGANSLIKRDRVRKTSDGYLFGWTLKGLLAMSERGARTKPHQIRPKLERVLKFTAGGETVFARSVAHPGAPIAARPSFDPSFRAELPGILSSIETELANVARQTGLL